MGKITAKILLTNLEDSLLVDRGLVPLQDVRSLNIDRAIIDTETTRLHLLASSS